ncbi:MAG: TonB-dependent receptor [Bacteroidales bacterium]|nr:TonB-dependent receptor [Bacteroidales bacterium]MCF8343663.1 TonB-dependent receptor [Bacteroidales bacterium]MCF8377729.1 TonB-dependent receptor [Bacteroidales bacterium]
MKKIFLLWLFLGMLHTAFSQTITVRDKESGEPLQQVTLISHDPRAFTTTNSKGQADITAFRGSQNIEIRTLGHKTLYRSYRELQLEGFKIQMDPSVVNMDELVISATRWSQASSDVPARITTITRREVSLQNPQTAADLLEVSGQVFVQKSQQGGGSPMIRGFATNRLLYTVDGVRMNTAIFRGGNIQNVISLDPFAIEKTEVLFGPGSVIYGSDALGGVMSFKTLVPGFSLDDKPLVSGKGVIRYASANNEKTAHFDANVGWKKWAMVTSISSNDYGNLKMGSHGPDDYLKPYYVMRIDSLDQVVENKNPKVQKPSGYSQINMMQKVRFSPNEEWDFQYGFHYSETSEYGRYDRHLRMRDGHPRYGEWSYGPQKWMMNNLSILHRGNNRLYDRLSIRLAQQYFEESRISRNFNSPNRETRLEEVDAYSANFDFNKSTSDRNTLMYGVEYVLNEVTSSGTDENINTGKTQPGPARYPQSNWASYGVYVSNQLELSKKTQLQAGARYNQFVLDADFDTTFYPFPFTEARLNKGALTGNIGLTHRPDRSWVLKMNVSTAFRSPNVDDVGKVFDSEPGAVVVPNPDLKAEYSYNLDLGMAKIIGENVRFDLNAYYTVLDHALVRREYTLNGMDSIMYDGVMSRVQAIQNAAVAHIYGFWAGLEFKLPAGFEFSSDFNYQKGTEELDDGTKSPTRHAPPWFGVSRLKYRTGKLNMQFYAQYSGERKHEDMPEEEKGKTEIYAKDANGNTYSPSWYTINFKAMYQLGEMFAISAGLENLTDQRYRPYSSGISAPGRNFIISMQMRF